VNTAALALLLVAVQGQGAPAQALIDEFKSVCVETNADPQAALARLAKEGWSPAPELETGPRTKSATSLVARQRNYDGARWAVELQEGVSEEAGLQTTWRSCDVMTTVDDPAAVIRFAESVVPGVRPIESDSAGRFWVYAQTSAGPKNVQTNAFAQQVLRDGRMRRLIVSDQQTSAPDGNTALSYTVEIAR
jgi:hypothetical protein